MFLDAEVNEISSPSKPKQAKINIMIPPLSATLDKCKISDRDAVHLLTAAAKSFQVNFLEFTINRSTIDENVNSYQLSEVRFKHHLNDIIVHRSVISVSPKYTFNSKNIPSIIISFVTICNRNLYVCTPSPPKLMQIMHLPFS
jgi:hypothetical protein